MPLGSDDDRTGKITSVFICPSLLRAGRIFLLVLCIVDRGESSARSQSSAVRDSNPGAMRPRVSRRTLQPAALVEAAETVDTSRSVTPQMLQQAGLIPADVFWMGTDHMEDAQPVHQVE